MKVALTGATGIAGGGLLAALRAAGHEVTVLGRRPLAGAAHQSWALGQPAELGAMDALVHAAFAHAPGRYRGGEGDDPTGFRYLNLNGTLRLFAAMPQGRPIVFLSSRAVYDGWPAGTVLTEDHAPRPQDLYGEVKTRAEQALFARGGASLRATGLYGPGPAMKWRSLFDAFDRGETPAPRVATELHVADMAAAALMLIETRATGAFNASGLTLDRRDLLTAYLHATGRTAALRPDQSAALPGPLPAPLPNRADPGALKVMRCDRLRDLGWRPRPASQFAADLGDMLKQQP
ncbi:NAD(P)-dependent oxidoreductase [Mesobaculum littorinae]|uniref:NAD(P)-dependent oxidoreductase n=1 Tax=Mesobaculum littorinae TaxID=2486419 RepID=A0A438AKX4_9RHOB|nr:NAD(P)-dependent oxidoreductase [Mesobaculum littorinae]RVV99473.1 NAD(P)-dependent oxidoreductase [Mesobaculum littorinae]